MSIEGLPKHSVLAVCGIGNKRSSASYEKVLREAKDSALQEMMERANMMGANAIVGIDLDYETIGANGSMLMVAASGTAVVI